MHGEKLKIIFIPAESLSVHFSRSYFIFKELSRLHTIYKLSWYDNRDIYWKGKKPSKLNTVSSFIRSFFQKTSIKKINKHYEVKCSILIDAFIGRILGQMTSKKLMRKYNSLVLKKLENKIKPDVIFFADGFYFFPAIESNAKIISDLQDDFIFSNKLSAEKCEILYNYYRNQYSKSNLNFTISNSTKHSVEKKLKVQNIFKVVENGADFELINSFNSVDITSLKEKYNLLNKTILTYIGGELWFDKKFVQDLVTHCEKNLPDVQFVFIGNLPEINGKYVSNIGLVNPKIASLFYRVSDVGLLLKDGRNSEFLYNSAPLKIIQYSAAKKPIITFPLNWLEKKYFENCIVTESNDLDLWTTNIKNAINFNWEKSLDEKWSNYSWSNKINIINAEINNLFT